MSSIKEKVTDLLDDIQRNGNSYEDFEMFGMRVPVEISNEEVADHLIANGLSFVSKSNIVTNADWLKAMSVDKLAEFLANIQYDSDEPTKEEMLNWLQLPAEEQHF